MAGSEIFTFIKYCCPMNDCGKEYQSKFNLKKHFKVSHLKGKCFECLTCNKSFVSKQNLQEHSYIHSGLKPFRCSFCGKKFRQTSQLSLHKRKHKKQYKETLKFALDLENGKQLFK